MCCDIQMTRPFGDDIIHQVKWSLKWCPRKVGNVESWKCRNWKCSTFDTFKDKIPSTTGESPTLKLTRKIFLNLKKWYFSHTAPILRKNVMWIYQAVENVNEGQYDHRE